MSLLQWHRLSSWKSKDNNENLGIMQVEWWWFFPHKWKKEEEGRKKSVKNVTSHTLLLSQEQRSVQSWLCSSWGVSVEVQCFTSHPPTPHVPTRDSCRQRRSLFLPSSSVSPARIIILHLWHHHELQWGGWDVTNRGFCHKLRILAPEWAREKRNPKDCLPRQSFRLCKPQKTWQ